MPFSPLGKGFLTRKIDESTSCDSTDFRNTVPRFAPEARRPGGPTSELTDEELHGIETAASGIELVGARYSEASQKMIDR